MKMNYDWIQTLSLQETKYCQLTREDSIVIKNPIQTVFIYLEISTVSTNSVILKNAKIGVRSEVESQFSHNSKVMGF